MSKVFTDKEILDFVENNIELTKDDAGQVTLVNVSCDVKFVHGNVDFIQGDVKFVFGDVKFVFGDVGSGGCDAESVSVI
tara:strand:+ start:167 stop:403 length:237 start_codon:yes stop_codon:yes gene_type:complete